MANIYTCKEINRIRRLKTHTDSGSDRSKFDTSVFRVARHLILRLTAF